ncbi:DUF2795 domain-containing protein [Methanoculleus frigidifontis]|nr:DUF2795 domain-containing protein [Methanoculleus sp. FWC-SCC1]
MAGMKESGASSAMQELDPQIIAVQISGVDYPASKQDLIERAKFTDSPQMVIDVLNQFEDRDYKSQEDVKSEAEKLMKRI